MLGFVVRRLAAGLPVLFIITIFAFAIINMAHGDPAVAMFGNQLEKMREQDQERIRENLGLDQPLPIRYGKWLTGVFQGELGRSYIDGRPVADLITERLWSTAFLSGAALVTTALVAVVAGVLSALKPHSTFDHITTVLSLVFYSIPSFWLSMLFILIFAVYFGVLPSSGISSIGRETDITDRLRHLLLPVLVLSLSHAGPYIRLVRSSMVETLAQDYMITARAKGLSQFNIYFHHALRNALIPFITYLGLSFASLIGGAYLVETVFAYPGLGQLTVYAAATRDYPVLMASVLLTGAFVVVGNMVADILCAWIDPRMKLGMAARRTGHG